MTKLKWLAFIGIIAGVIISGFNLQEKKENRPFVEVGEQIFTAKEYEFFKKIAENENSNLPENERDEKIINILKLADPKRKNENKKENIEEKVNKDETQSKAELLLENEIKNAKSENMLFNEYMKKKYGMNITKEEFKNLYEIYRNSIRKMEYNRIEITEEEIELEYNKDRKKYDMVLFYELRIKDKDAKNKADLVFAKTVDEKSFIEASKNIAGEDPVLIETIADGLPLQLENWLFDENRKEGSISIIKEKEDEYIVLYFKERKRFETARIEVVEIKNPITFDEQKLKAATEKNIRETVEAFGKEVQFIDETFASEELYQWAKKANVKDKSTRIKDGEKTLYILIKKEMIADYRKEIENKIQEEKKEKYLESLYKNIKVKFLE